MKKILCALLISTFSSTIFAFTIDSNISDIREVTNTTLYSDFSAGESFNAWEFTVFNCKKNNKLFMNVGKAYEYKSNEYSTVLKVKVMPGKKLKASILYKQKATYDSKEEHNEKIIKHKKDILTTIAKVKTCTKYMENMTSEERDLVNLYKIESIEGKRSLSKLIFKVLLP